MITIFDFETTGLPDKDARGKWEHPSQPWPVSIAAVLLDNDLNHVAEMYDLTQIPQNVEINPKAEEIHGISRARLEAEGKPAMDVLQKFKHDFIDKSSVYLAYNLPFDETVAKAWAKRLGSNDPANFFAPAEGACLLRLATNYLRIPGGHQGYRQVKLFQAYRRIVGVPMDSVYTAHNALEDVKASVDVYKAMLKSMVVS